MNRLLLHLGMSAGVVVAGVGGLAGVASAQAAHQGVYTSIPATVAPFVSGSHGTQPPVISQPPTSPPAAVTSPAAAAGPAAATSPAPVSPAAASPAAASPFTAPSASSGSLAFTGADIVGTGAFGALLLGGGVVMVALSRRRHQGQQS